MRPCRLMCSLPPSPDGVWVAPQASSMDMTAAHRSLLLVGCAYTSCSVCACLLRASATPRVVARVVNHTRPAADAPRSAAAAGATVRDDTRRSSMARRVRGTGVQVDSV